MVSVVAFVEEERWGPVYVEDDEIKIAIIVNVFERDVPARLESTGVQTRMIRDVLEGVPLEIAKELQGFMKLHLTLQVVHQ